MSGTGGDPEEASGNHADGSYYNLFPESSQPGLFGGQYAEMMANAPLGVTAMDAAALGLNPDIGGDGTGLPPSVTITPNLPQLSDALPVGNYQTPNAATSAEAPGTNTAGNPDAVAGYDLPGIGQTYFDPEFAKRLDDFRQRAQADGFSLGFASGYRSQAGQNALKSDPTATAPAKFSLHSTGDAVDVSSKLGNNLDPATQRRLVDDAAKSGLGWGGNFRGDGNDPRHFYYDPGGDRMQRIKDFADAVQAFKNGQK
jgi:hypothetical protein